MINNERFFQRLMTVLRSIDRRFFLPKAFEDYLRDHMKEIYYSWDKRILCEEGSIPSCAYFIIRGFITLSFYDDNGTKYVMRIYRENRICGLISFIHQLKSNYTITMSKDSILLSIDHRSLTGLYDLDERLKEFVLVTSLHYEHYKEQFRETILGSENADVKVRMFYDSFKGLLGRRGIVTDEDIASYLHISVAALKRSRERYKKERGIGVLRT